MLAVRPDKLPPIPPADFAADRLNHACFCIALDRQAQMGHLEFETELPVFGAALASSHPALFSNVPVFVSEETVKAMKSVVAAVEAASLLPEFQAAAMAWAPLCSIQDFGPVDARTD